MRVAKQMQGPLWTVHSLLTIGSKNTKKNSQTLQNINHTKIISRPLPHKPFHKNIIRPMTISRPHERNS